LLLLHEKNILLREYLTRILLWRKIIALLANIHYTPSMLNVQRKKKSMEINWAKSLVVNASLGNTRHRCFHLGAVYKWRPQSGGGDLFSADIFRIRGEGVFRCGRPRTFWGKKLRIFRNFGVSAQTRGGWASVDFCRQGGRGQFLRFCADVFYGRPLIE